MFSSIVKFVALAWFWFSTRGLKSDNIQTFNVGVWGPLTALTARSDVHIEKEEVYYYQGNSLSLVAVVDISHPD